MECKRRNILKSALGFSAFTAFAGIGAVPLLAAENGVLRMGMFKPAGDLNPQRYSGIWGVQAAIFDPLVAYGQDGTIEPALAESWTFNDDKTIITFRLRKGVKFTDGALFNAESMIWGMKRWIGTKTGNWLGISRAFKELVKIDDLTVELHLNSYVPSALQELVIVRPVRFLSPSGADAEGNYLAPIGSGPWILESNDETKTVLVRNEDYWGPKPSFKKLELIVIPDSNSRISALRAGDIDVTGGTKVGPISPQEALTLKSASGITVFHTGAPSTMILGINPDREFIRDVNVRNAMSLCIDRQAISDKLLNGYATPTMNLFPEMIPYSGKRYDVPTRNIEKAKMLLEEAGWIGDGVRTKDGKPLELELVISEDAIAGSRSLGEVIQGQLSEAGFGIKLRQVDHLSRHDDIPAKKYDLALFVTFAAPYDPNGSLVSLFLSTREPGTDGKIYTDTELDPLLLAATEAFGDAKESAHQAVYDWLDQRRAIIPIYHGEQIWAHSERVAKFELPPTEYEIPFVGLTLKN